MKKKLLALFLCCVMVFSLVPVALTSAFTTGNGFQIYSSNGTVAETVLLQMSKKMDLTAVAETGSGNYQWQIRVSGDVWANIVGTSGNTLELSYGLVANALDNDAAEIRCKLTNDVGNVSYSNIVTVQIQPDSTVRRAPAASPAVGTVISEAQPIGEPVIVPADAPSYYNAPAANSEPVVNDTPTVSGESNTDAEPAPVSNDEAADGNDDSVLPDDSVPVNDPAPVNDIPANDVPTDETPTNDTPTPTTYAILINYQFADGRKAAPSWSATVATGSTYTQDIHSPVVVGYTPDQPVVHVNTSEAKTYTVTYQPAEVEFTVKHYQQNVSNDEYTLVDTETKKGYTEAAVGAGLAKTDYTGFYSLLYDTTTTIAADGSTVVEVYYDRYYYLMNFDLDGGYGVEPIYARFGAPISVDTPTKPGYTFEGWTPSIPATMPADNTSYTASWNKCGDTAFTVAFYYENADDNGYTFMDSKVYQGTTGDKVSGSAYKDENFSGKDTKHFTYLDGKTDKNIEIKGDGSTVVKVYFSRNVYTMNFYGITCGKGWNIFHSHSKNCCKEVTASISAKYNANIAQRYAEITQNHRWSRWDADACTALVSYMPDNSNPNALKYWQKSDGSTVYNITYAYESENGTINHDGKKFTALATSNVPMGYVGYSEDYLPAVRNGYSAYTDYSKAASPRFQDNGQIKKTKKVTLFYYANTYTLRFMNAETELHTANVKYNFSIKSNSSFTPDASYAPNGMVFDCWCLDSAGAQPVDWSTQKMPAGDLVLYARWKSRIHTVKTYLTKDVLDDGGNPLDTWNEVPHGTAVTNPPAAPVNGQYTFVGWFYISDTGEEKAYNFSMPVNRDLNLYAKWSSNTLMEYTIRYELEDGTKIAPPTTGSALAGTTKTFDAKTGTQLNDGYQSGYFPQTSSHSLTIDIEGTDENKLNEFIFVYVAKEKVSYRVEYRYADTKELIPAEKITGADKNPVGGETSNAVITETFKVVPGYAPDAYQKRLVLSADEEQNVITFWYVKDNDHAPVQIIHWTQNIEGEGYTEFQSSTNLNGVIKTKYSVTPLTIAGFRYNGGKSNASDTLTEAGLVLNLYYDRIEYPYEFRFVEKDSDPEKQLTDSVTGSARYQAQVTQRAKDIPGYTLVSAENQAIHIAIEDGETAVKNVKVFYYAEQTVDIKYVVVGPDGCGTLDNYQESQLKAITGEVKGSAPAAAEGFKFVGWYTDADCTQPVDADWVKDSKLTPGKTKNYGTAEKPVMGYEAATYYAKFEYDVADLTITKQGCENIDENQSFLFDVTGPNGYSTRVVINGNGSVIIKGLKIGEYTVKEVTSWSWRYTTSNNSKKITLKPTENNTVTFENNRSKDKWLGGDAYKQNIFKNIFGN